MKADPNEIRKSARHKTLRPCSRHEKYNATIISALEVSSEHADFLLLVPKWNPTHADNRKKSSLTTSLIGGENKYEFTSLHRQADFFFTKILKIDSRHLSDLLKPTLDCNSGESSSKTITNLLEHFD